MLRDFGVRGVKVQEVVSLDEEMMAFLKYGACAFGKGSITNPEQQASIRFDLPLSLASR